MSDRLLSGVSGHTDYPGFSSFPDTPYGTHDAYDLPAQAQAAPASGYDGTASYGDGGWTATTTVPQVSEPLPRDPWYDQQHAFSPGPWDSGSGYGAASLHDAPTTTVPVLDQDLRPGGHAHAYDSGYPQATGVFHGQYAENPGGYAEQGPADYGTGAYGTGTAYQGDGSHPGNDGASGAEYAVDTDSDPYGDPDPYTEPEPYADPAPYADPEPYTEPPADLRETTAEMGAVPAREAGPAAPDDAPGPEPVVEVAPPQRQGGRGRRRSVRPRARSAFLSVAAPSLCVLGVTAVATAATVNDTTGGVDDPAPVAAPDPAEAEPIEANQQFDTQLVSLSAAADAYAERASRTQGRMDLEIQQEQEAEAAAEEAARIEAARQKFFVPVEQHGLSAYYGQAGVNWMSSHTGIDFPVSYGTPVMAATDGTISTQWHPSYGNLVVLTAADGTETWYAHLDSSVYQSGWVQAGTVIAYSGNSGNSTGPHLHFEVRPGGGAAIDPLPWLRSHGLEPT